jgi:hypothetical protein
MFEKYMICEGGFRNARAQGQVVGFEFRARLPYYRGLGISMIEDIAVTVDGEKISRERIRVTLGERTFALDEMERDYQSRWEFGEEGTITVLKPGGLTPGRHRLELTDQLRISYLPFPLTGSDAKELELQG